MELSLPLCAAGASLMLFADRLSRSKTFFYACGFVAGVIGCLFLLYPMMPRALQQAHLVVALLLHGGLLYPLSQHQIPVDVVALYIIVSGLLGLGATHVYLKHAELATSAMADNVFVGFVLGGVCALVAGTPAASRGYAVLLAGAAIPTAIWWRARAPADIVALESHNDAVARRWAAADKTAAEMQLLVDSPQFKAWMVRNSHRIYMPPEHTE